MESAEALQCSPSAARAKLPCWAMATKACNCRKSGFMRFQES